MLKKLTLFAATIILMMTFGASAFAYVNVKGYYRKDGTYVSPHVKSKSNGIKFDNYSWTPSQGLYNKTYGTKGSTWDTPAYISDPDYYKGKSLYESGSSGASSAVTNKYFLPTTNYNYGSYITGQGCTYGYTKDYINNTCKKVFVPTNATLNYFGDGWSCNKGYNKNYIKNNCELIIVPANAELNYFGDDWQCKFGYKKNYLLNSCDKVLVPQNATLNYFGDDWVCNSGFQKNYIAKVCTPK